ncbi:hypothetical protein [Deinococcus radiotolerans]|uniref:hypothetical protein n=1 Tax=Deinococcus radiotolerans TaxID=1309407 RepID=UPI00166C6B3A|nr:hypothetical protein [Deinococcus radiotolerans]
MTTDALSLDLAAYLDTVTAPFPEDSAARIRADLTGHVLDATAPGEPDAASIRAALVALGPADEVRAALEAQFFTRADVAWLERDQRVRRLLTERTRGPGPVWTAVLRVGVIVGVLTWLACGWPGLPALFGPRAFTWAVPALLALELTLLEIGQRVVQRRSVRSAAVLRRVFETLVAPLGVAVNLLVFVPGVIAEPVLLAAALGGALLGAYLKRPREALILAGKAWRGAR